MNTARISIKEKFSYGLGDTGCNLVWQTVMLFMAWFYTDVFGLSPAHMGTMFLAVRVLDAVTDVLMGAVADRTRTKYGQFRPYILWFAIPFGVLCCLTFYTPDFGYTGKLIYAYVSYTLLSLVYTAINVPYCAMINNISNDSRERVSLQSWRFALSTLGGLIVSLTALPLVAWLGQGNVQNGYFYTMIVMGCLSIILFFICFGLTKERYTTDIAVNNQSSILDDLKTLLANKDWRILFALNVVNLIAVLFKGGTTLYYVNNIMGRADLGSLLLTTTLASGVLGAMLSPFIFKNIDKVKGFKNLDGHRGGAADRHVLRPGGERGRYLCAGDYHQYYSAGRHAAAVEHAVRYHRCGRETQRQKTQRDRFFNKPVCHQAGDRHRRRAGGLYAGMGRLRWRRSAANRLRAADDRVAVHRLPRGAGGAADCYHE